MTGRLQSSMSGADDATLARAAAAGDRVAFAEIYDRYADRLHDFCVGMLRDRDAAADCVQDVFVTAATKLVQLREPDRLRSWLYAIARSEALSRIRERKREQPSEELPDMPSGEADPATLAARGELAELIRQASGGLSDRDRVVLELAYRQGLDGPELADALGVTPKNANTLVERLRDTIARSLGALLLCRHAKADPNRCPELAAIVSQLDREGAGEFTVLMRKRVARHIDTCAVCEEDRARMVTPAALLGATPIVMPAPAWLRQRTLDRAVIKVRPGGPIGPEDDASWWPPRDLDTRDLPGGSGSRLRRNAVRVGVGAAVLLIGIGAAALSGPAVFRVVPADSHEKLAPPTTTTTLTTTPSIVERIVPSATPSTLPPSSVTTTTVVETTTDITTAPETTPPPTPGHAPVTNAPQPSTTTSEPVITTSRPVTTQPQPTFVLPTQASPVTTTDAPPSTAAPTKPKPTFTVPKAPPRQVGPICPQTNPNCNVDNGGGGGGGGPVIS